MAGEYYLKSANYYVQCQNYFMAYKSAEFAFECFEKIKYIGHCKNSIGLATRTAIQLNHHGRAAYCIKKWYDLIEKDHSSTHLSVARKGFKTFMNLGQHKDALIFIEDIVRAHYEHGNKQDDILPILINAQKLYLQANKSENALINVLIESELKDHLAIASYYLEVRKLCEDIGLRDISDKFFVKENIFRKVGYRKTNKWLQYISYKFWEVSSNFGTSAVKWIVLSILISICFGLIYSSLPCPEFVPKPIQNILYALNPAILIESHNNKFSPFYFSIVTFTTLGFGDITPLNLSAQIFIVIEVLIGYLMLGGLITIFFRKIIR